jgi:hypothetical protein
METPGAVCAFCGMGVNCEHGKCNGCSPPCKACIRLDRAWEDLGNTLREMGNEDTDEEI